MAGPLDILKDTVERIFSRCQVPGCSFFTLGAVCGTCSRRVCLKHGYVTLQAPPTSICACCVIVEQADLLVDARKSGREVIFPEIVDDGGGP